MSNKINGVDHRPVTIGAGARVARGRDASTGDAGRPASSGGAVQITESARRLAALEQALRAMPAIDEARVAEVSRALADGTYEVRPGRIADELLRLERELAREPRER